METIKITIETSCCKLNLLAASGAPSVRAPRIARIAWIKRIPSTCRGGLIDSMCHLDWYFSTIYGTILLINIFSRWLLPHQPVVIFHDPPVIERVNGASPLNGGVQLGKSSNQMPDFPASLTPEGRKKIIKM